MMIRNFKIVKVDYKYCDYLRKYDSKVVWNAGSKELRPFIGVLFAVDGCEYFAPLSSPKEKHLGMKNNIDFVKIDGGKLGVVNFNNMIPVTPNNYELFDLNTIPTTQREINHQNLLKSQLMWLNKNIKAVKDRAINLYEKYKDNKLPERIRSRCCNFILLEEVSKNYNS
ncbi:MAG: type III toxin-antitoxin system ToxN/AbiQ family toxin [Clostridiaceae bacterium]|nr:type III toxin-antitoxin system ToxN/AbiQ family toxin [Clostridiaceae bacterium]